MEKEDRELLGRVRGGDPRAVEALYARFGDRLYRFALSRLRDRDAAEDAVQETIIAAWKGASAFRGGSAVSTWLFGICRNKVCDQLAARGPAVEGLEWADSLPGAPMDASPIPFWQAFAGLSQEHQELILLVFYCGFSQGETAEILGLPVGTVKSRTHYARRHLQRLLEQGEEQG